MGALLLLALASQEGRYIAMHVYDSLCGRQAQDV